MLWRACAQGGFAKNGLADEWKDGVFMPLYLFACKECGHKFETLTSFSRIEEVVCEKCGGQVERVYDGASVFGGASSKEPAQAAACPHCCPGCPNAVR